MNNMQKTPLQEAVARAHALGRRAVIPFITAGFPDKDSFWTHLSRIDESGADIIEIGVPFSDPGADGPVIEQASRDALARGVSLKWILDGLKARKGCFSAKLVPVSYTHLDVYKRQSSAWANTVICPMPRSMGQRNLP